tara:strand:+ start:2375 stop:4237 length:1863 start_codon:yes stop_codon:yes gene_type:complete
MNTENSLLIGISLIKEELTTIPNKPGIYKMLDGESNVLYIGKAKNLFKRVNFYTQPNRLNTRLSNMIRSVKNIQIEITSTEIEALLLESNLIKLHKPLYNILLKDDKSFSTIFISTDHAFPQISSHRGKRSKKGEYFGPFISKGAIVKTIETIQKAFLLRNCNDNAFSSRKRPCLQYQIKRCSAPCVNLISQKEYNAKVKDTIKFLSGDTSEIKENLAKHMRHESKNQNFEKAAIYRNRLQALSDITAYQTINNEQIEDLDILVLKKKNNLAVVQTTIFRSGSNYGSIPFFPKINSENSLDEIIEAFVSQFYNKYIPPKLILVNIIPKQKKLLEEFLSSRSKLKTKIQKPIKGLKYELIVNSKKNAEEFLNRKIYEKSSNKSNLELLKTRFKIDTQIKKIEIYDNSHIQGNNPIGAMVVFSVDGFTKSLYRKFNFNNSNNYFNKKNKDKVNNDYFMMENMISRRFQSKNNINFPQVIIIDGGVGHLNVVLNVLKKLSINNVYVIAIAKGKERNSGKETIFANSKTNINLEKNDPTRFFLQNLRDEAHRFAIGAHRNKRTKALFASPLDEIESIGKKRKKNLLDHFGSAKAVRKASLNDLLKVPDLNKKIAEKVYNFFNDS